MNKILWIFVYLFASFSIYANCDLTRFRWECDMPLNPNPSKSNYSLVYCGNSYGYVSRADYERLVRYQRANVNMIMTINGDYVDSPCIPAGRFGAE